MFLPFKLQQVLIFQKLKKLSRFHLKSFHLNRLQKKKASPKKPYPKYEPKHKFNESAPPQMTKQLHQAKLYDDRVPASNND